MARPKKSGLSYFPLDADFFDDNKIKILKARYRADGIAMYVYLLCEIYKHGYYIKVDDDFEYIISDDLGIDQNKVKQVLNFLLKRSLFNDKLFNVDKVLTSAGIQRRFQLAIKERARKNPIEVGRYWLLSKEETEPFIKCTLFGINPVKTDGFSGNNQDDSNKNTIKESKVNTIYITAFQPRELEDAFQMYLIVRKHNYGEILPEQIQALRDELIKLSSNTNEQIAMVKKATVGGWKNFYKLKKEKPKEQRPLKPANNKFNNFKGRDYDMDDFERKVLEAQQRQMEENQERFNQNDE